MLISRQLVNLLRAKPRSLTSLVLRASICHKSELPPIKRRRWPYETTSYGFFNFYLDPFTRAKFNENSKIIQIEGNVECGKEDFGRRLANELGMHYMPDIDLDGYYVNQHGYDYRALNPLLPERLRNCDWEMFHENPTRHSTVHLLEFVFKLRFYQYIKALQHVFNTGEGVVMNRSVFSDIVFIEALHEIGWLPRGYLRGDGVQFYDWKTRYNYTRNLALKPLPKPHLTLYLETPPETCLDRIKKSKDPMIANSKALVPELLEAIERAYKGSVLPRFENSGHVLKYDYSERMTDDEILDVIDDINPLDFEYDVHDTRFEEWHPEGYCWHTFMRRRLTTLQPCLSLFQHLTQPWYDIAGLGDSVTEHDLKLRTVLIEAHVGPMGYFRTYSADTRVQSVFKAFFDYNNFGQRLHKHIYNDYV